MAVTEGPATVAEEVEGVAEGSGREETAVASSNPLLVSIYLSIGGGVLLTGGCWRRPRIGRGWGGSGHSGGGGGFGGGFGSGRKSFFYS